MGVPSRIVGVRILGKERLLGETIGVIGRILNDRSGVGLRKVVSSMFRVGRELNPFLHFSAPIYPSG